MSRSCVAALSNSGAALKDGKKKLGGLRALKCVLADRNTNIHHHRTRSMRWESWGGAAKTRSIIIMPPPDHIAAHLDRRTAKRRRINLLNSLLVLITSLTKGIFDASDIYIRRSDWTAVRASIESDGKSAFLSNRAYLRISGPTLIQT